MQHTMQRFVQFGGDDAGSPELRRMRIVVEHDRFFGFGL
jgi:hypothetical protein